MRIAVDIRTLLDREYSGVQEYTYNLLSALLELDKENRYVLYRNSWRKPRTPELPVGRADIITTRYPNKLFNYFLQTFCRYPKLDLICADGADKIAGEPPRSDRRRTSPSGGVGIFFAPHLNFYALSGRAKSVLTVHDLSFLRHPEFFSLRKNLWHRALRVKNLVHRFDCLIAISDNTKRDLIELLGVPEENIKVIYSGIGAEFKPLAPDRPEARVLRQKYGLPDKFILYLGTLEPRKNAAGLIAAYDRLLEGNPEFSEYRLVIAGGSGWLADEIFAAERSAKHRQNIIFTGYIPAADRAALYNLASLFVYPSFYEGFGFPPLEAMACGVPVITSAASSLPEVVGQAAVLIDPYDIDDMAGAMRAVLEDKNLAEKLIAAGRERAKIFNWQKTAAEYLAVFDEL